MSEQRCAFSFSISNRTILVIVLFIFWQDLAGKILPSQIRNDSRLRQAVVLTYSAVSTTTVRVLFRRTPLHCRSSGLFTRFILIHRCLNPREAIKTKSREKSAGLIRIASLLGSLATRLHLRFKPFNALVFSKSCI